MIDGCVRKGCIRPFDSLAEAEAAATAAEAILELEGSLERLLTDSSHLPGLPAGVAAVSVVLPVLTTGSRKSQHIAVRGAGLPTQHCLRPILCCFCCTSQSVQHHGARRTRP